MAVCKAGAAHKGVPLYRHIADLAGVKDVLMPVPCLNVINGGSHAGNKLAMQEFMVLPLGASCFSEAMRMGSELYHHLKALIKKKYGLDATAVGDEGGFAPNFQNNGEALELLVEAIKKSGYEGKIKIGMDIAASEFFKDGKYDLDFKNPETKAEDWISSDQLLEMYQGKTLHCCKINVTVVTLLFCYQASSGTTLWSALRTPSTRTTGRDTPSSPPTPRSRLLETTCWSPTPRESPLLLTRRLAMGFS